MSRSSSRASPSTARTFEELALERDPDVARGAALIARDAYPDLDVDKLIARLDPLAAQISGSLADATALEQAVTLCEHVYGHLGFHGNEDDYYAPENSLLSDVLERRTGIPISLALVYCEVARRVGVSARGVGFPGHFLVRVDVRGETTIVDPFVGRAIDADGAEALLRRTVGDHATLTPEHFRPARPREILARMLANLKTVYLARADFARAHVAVDRILSLLPKSTAALRERAILARKLGAAESARADFARVLELEPDAEDARELQAALREIAREKRSLN